jgi:hypothetical protein
MQATRNGRNFMAFGMALPLLAAVALTHYIGAIRLTYGARIAHSSYFVDAATLAVYREKALIPA